MTQLLSARPQPRLITQDIPQSVVEDDSLSTKGKKVTLITVMALSRYMDRSTVKKRNNEESERWKKFLGQ